MEVVIASILAFASTNVDDIFVLILFYSNKKMKGSEIVNGQFIGIIALIAISLAGSLVGLILDKSYIGLLGLVPIFMGCRGIVTWFNKKTSEEDSIEVNTNKNHVLTVASTTIANGGDNIGVYVPLFAALTWMDRLSMISIFLMMTFIWCLIARYFMKHPYVAKVADKYGHIITPFVLVLLGLYILHESETIGLLKF